MNSGSFFRLDLETSKVVGGITFYNYIDLPDLSAVINENHYPVRVSIAKDRVTFLVHYYKENEIPSHSEEVILDLPFVSNNPEALASSIKHCYNTAFPLSDYLRDLLERRYIKDDNEYRHIRASQINKDSYSSLTIWGIIDQKENGLCSYKIHNDNNQITKFLRKLLLDFMFDLMHSDVFESSKYYTQMRAGLMSDFFFSSIVKKCEFYYIRRLIKNSIKDVLEDSEYLLNYSGYMRKKSRYEKWRTVHKLQIQEYIYNKLKLDDILIDGIIGLNALIQAHNSTNTVLDSIRVLYAEELKDAESAWVDAIMSPLAEKHFPFSPEWFEDEVDRKKHKGFTLSESWFVNPEEEMNRVMFPLDENDDEKQKKRRTKQKVIHYLNSYELSHLIGAKDRSSIFSQNSIVSKWYYHRFDFADAFRIHLFKKFHSAFFSFLACLFVFAILAFLHPDLLKHPSYASWLIAAASFGCLSTTIVFMKEIRRTTSFKKPDDLLVIKRKMRECRKALRLGLGFLGIWLVLFYSESISLCQFIGKMIVLLSSIVLLLGIRRKENGINNAHLFFPRLVASITAAWIMLVIGNDLFKERFTVPLWFVISIIVFVFILYENNKTLPNLDTKKKLFRALELMGVSYVISLFIGLFAIDIIANNQEIQKSLVCKYEVYNWYFLMDCPDLTLTVCPQFLVPFSFLAMFIGVFIQMIFEEKNITEM